jgi:hypothetical protein
MGLLQRGVDERKLSTDTLTAPEITYLLRLNKFKPVVQ